MSHVDDVALDVDHEVHNYVSLQRKDKKAGIDGRKGERAWGHSFLRVKWQRECVHGGNRKKFNHPSFEE